MVIMRTSQDTQYKVIQYGGNSEKRGGQAWSRAEKTGELFLCSVHPAKWQELANDRWTA